MKIRFVVVDKSVNYLIS